VSTDAKVELVKGGLRISGDESGATSVRNRIEQHKRTNENHHDRAPVRRHRLPPSTTEVARLQLELFYRLVMQRHTVNRRETMR